MHEKIIYLIKNMGWMTISNFGSKILIFLLVPFYTRVLTTEEYGIYDISYTIVVLCVPLLTASIAESVMRFVIIDNDKTDVIFSSGFT